MKFKPVITAFIVFFICTAVYSAGETGFANKNEMQAYCESIMSKVKTGNISEAFDLLKKQWVVPAAELDNLEQQTMGQLEMVKERFGAVLDYKLVKVQEVADVSIKYTYIIKYERHITRWIFIFYKPSNRWLVNSFRWDDSIDSLFTE